MYDAIFKYLNTNHELFSTKKQMQIIFWELFKHGWNILLRMDFRS